MRDHIYSIIEKTFEANGMAFADAQLEPIKQIDMFFGQYSLTQQYETFMVPALFLEINCEYSHNERNPYGLAHITTHLVLSNNQATDNIKKRNFRKKIFTYHNIMRSVIEQAKSQHFRSPLLIRQEPIEALDTFILIKENFQSRFVDGLGKS